jgi:hypothetical protein
MAKGKATATVETDETENTDVEETTDTVETAEEPKAKAKVEPAAAVVKAEKTKMVKVLCIKDHTTSIGGRKYTLTRNKEVELPDHVAGILGKQNLVQRR